MNTKDDKAHNIHDKYVHHQFQSRNLIHDKRLLTVPKISFQMILKNKDPLQDHLAKNDPGSGSNVLNLNRDRDRLQKYWANYRGLYGDFYRVHLKSIRSNLI